LPRRGAGKRAHQLPIARPEHCLALLDAYAAAGAQQIVLWPIRDPIRQLHIFAEQVCGKLDA
jgi:hypothetical protein